jgi:hypothetical protein
LQAGVEEGKERRRGEGCGENERSICVAKVGREWREKAGLTEPWPPRRREEDKAKASRGGRRRKGMTCASRFAQSCWMLTDFVKPPCPCAMDTES